MQFASRSSAVRSGIQASLSLMSQRAISRELGARGIIGLSRQEVHSPRAAHGIRALVTSESIPSTFEHVLAAVPMSNEQNVAPVTEVVDPAEKWKKITVEMWRNAVYTNQTYFGDLIQDTNEFVKNIAEQIKLNGHRVSMVEVGCGTGEFVRANEHEFRTAVGVDFNQEFIAFCKTNAPARKVGSTQYFQGDACELNDLLKQKFPKCAARGSRGVEFWDDSRVVACVGNTIGIIPEELRPRVYEEMAELAGKDGVLVMVYWNARWFGDACLNFYHANPNLCGVFEGENVDFKNTTLKTPMGYRTKWTGADEARALMEDLGMEIISLREKGKGIFVAARRF
eukprot:CAMPEP_0172657004 /NCGR_PEP_ID=MMETSP1074-20121228/1806_1 /TAXON_ID=2916 /ORGANISM="Ceratium fusus, Strain PA161109" /LENGTH=339 /DNA_ID=CAMNT_0013472013 /DNA_START=71 /DNA_END=1090 /DNA_ORIENTATION=+